MNAADCKTLADNVSLKPAADLMMFIEAEAEKGNYHLWIEDTLNKQCVVYLEKLGFYITTSSKCNTTSTKISWENAK